VDNSRTRQNEILRGLKLLDFQTKIDSDPTSAGKVTAAEYNSFLKELKSVIKFVGANFDGANNNQLREAIESIASSKASAVQSNLDNHNHDTQYLGKTATAANSSKLTGVSGVKFYHSEKPNPEIRMGTIASAGNFDGITYDDVSNNFKLIADSKTVIETKNGEFSVKNKAGTADIVKHNETASDFGDRLLRNVKNPTDGQDVATKNYVDSKSGYAEWDTPTSGQLDLDYNTPAIITFTSPFRSNSIIHLLMDINDTDGTQNKQRVFSIPYVLFIFNNNNTNPLPILIGDEDLIEMELITPAGNNGVTQIKLTPRGNTGDNTINGALHTY
jgi:hypothetical protein